jgi:hypothetical protein
MHNTPGALLTTPAAALAFILAGDSRVTLVSTKTGNRFTYRIRQAEGDARAPHFVSVLDGPNNEEDFAFLGTIFWRKTYGVDRSYYHGRKSRISPNAPSAQAFEWAWEHIAAGFIPDGLEVWHEGRCGRCGRALTTPESIATGLGPVCAARGAA